MLAYTTTQRVINGKFNNNCKAIQIQTFHKSNRNSTGNTTYKGTTVCGIQITTKQMGNSNSTTGINGITGNNQHPGPTMWGINNPNVNHPPSGQCIRHRYNNVNRNVGNNHQQSQESGNGKGTTGSSQATSQLKGC